MNQATLPALSETLADDTYEIYQLCFSKIPERRIHNNVVVRDMHDGPMQLDFNLWILRNRNRIVLVDTGFGPRSAKERGRILDHDPVEALRQIGIDPAGIEDIILTHLHFDHAGNIERFDNARFHVQDAEVAFATGRCMCEHVMRLPFDVEDVVTLVRHTYANRVRFHDGEASPIPGVKLFPTPGHSKGMQSVAVKTPRGQVVLASDASHFFATMLQRAPFVVTVDAEATMRSYDRLLELAGSMEFLIPGHDPKLRTLYPAVTINGVELLALHEVPAGFTMEELAAFAWEAGQ